jgi:hypothetical protein
MALHPPSSATRHHAPNAGAAVAPVAAERVKARKALGALAPRAATTPPTERQLQPDLNMRESVVATIGLGANLGDPRATLVAVRPLLQALLEGLLEERGQAGPALGSPPSGSGGSGCGGLARPAAAPLALDRPTPHPLSPSS